MKRRDHVQETAIEGVLIPVRWNSAGEVSAVTIMTFDEAEYRVDTAATEAHRLRDHLRKHIRIHGRTRGRRVIEVTGIEVLGLHAPASSRPH